MHVALRASSICLCLRLSPVRPIVQELNARRGAQEEERAEDEGDVLASVADTKVAAAVAASLLPKPPEESVWTQFLEPTSAVRSLGERDGLQVEEDKEEENHAEIDSGGRCRWSVSQSRPSDALDSPAGRSQVTSLVAANRGGASHRTSTEVSQTKRRRRTVYGEQEGPLTTSDRSSATVPSSALYNASVPKTLEARCATEDTAASDSSRAGQYGIDYDAARTSTTVRKQFLRSDAANSISTTLMNQRRTVRQSARPPLTWAGKAKRPAPTNRFNLLNDDSSSDEEATHQEIFDATATQQCTSEEAATGEEDGEFTSDTDYGSKRAGLVDPNSMWAQFL